MPSFEASPPHANNMSNRRFTRASRRLPSRSSAAGWLLMWVLPACSGAVSADAKDVPRDTPEQHGSVDEPTGDGATDPPAGTTPTDPTPPTSPTPAAAGEATRLARLTHSQYANTVADLFGIEDMADTFPPDARSGFEFGSSVDFTVDGRIAPRYRQAAESIAASAVADAEIYRRVVPCESESTQCRDQFVADFGLRAFRRPLSEDEQARIVTLFGAAGELVQSGNAFRDGVQVVIEALLQSPYFLYRAELGNSSDGETVPLTDFEVASRLSYFLYDSMPDEDLFAAAHAGELSTLGQVQAQVARMLQTDEAIDQLVSFHEQAWHFAQYSKISPDPSVFLDLPNDLPTRLLAASRAFVRDVITSNGGAKQLLTAPFAYADAPIGRLYGVTVDEAGDGSVGGEIARIEFDPDTRLGLLSQVGFLASHAHTQKTDPIHRGLFVTRDLLCRSIGEPPPGASTAELPEGSPAPKTTREEVTLLTSPSGCVECHRLINPPGFAFEGFDAVGQIRDEEDGTPVETHTSVYLDGKDHDIDGAIDLIGLLADSAEFHACYASKWLAFAHGRKLARDEVADMNRFQTPLSVRDLVTLIATDQSFLARKATEVSQ